MSASYRLLRVGSICTRKSCMLHGAGTADYAHCFLDLDLILQHRTKRQMLNNHRHDHFGLDG